MYWLLYTFKKLEKFFWQTQILLYCMSYIYRVFCIQIYRKSFYKDDAISYSILPTLVNEGVEFLFRKNSSFLYFVF